MARHNDLGEWGEQLAADMLIEEGFAVIERRWRMSHCEIDIIAVKDDTVVFAEVKTRADIDVDPLEAVDRRKVARMVAAAEVYLRTHDAPYQVRFDLFAVNGTPDNYVIDHVPDAFYPPLRSYR